MKVELDVDLLGLAMLHLSRHSQSITPYNVLNTAEKILRWAGYKGKAHKEGNKLEFKNGHVIVDKKYLK